MVLTFFKKPAAHLVSIILRGRLVSLSPQLFHHFIVTAFYIITCSHFMKNSTLVSSINRGDIPNKDQGHNRLDDQHSDRHLHWHRSGSIDQNGDHFLADQTNYSLRNRPSAQDGNQYSNYAISDVGNQFLSTKRIVHIPEKVSTSSLDIWIKSRRSIRNRI